MDMAVSLTKDLSKKYNEKFQHSIATFRSGVGKIREQVNKLKLDNAKYEWSVLQLKEEKKISEEKNGALQIELDECKNILSDLREEKVHCEADLNSLLNENDKLKGQCIQFEEDVKNSILTNKSLKLKLESCEDRLNKLEQQHLDDKESYRILQEQSCKMSADLMSKQKDFELICKQKNEDELKIKSLSEEKNKLDERLKATLENEKQNSLRMKQKEEDIMKLSNKNEQIEASLRKLRTTMAKDKEINLLQDKKLSELKEANDTLMKERENFSKIDCDYNALKSKYESSLASEEKIGKQLEQIQKQNEDLREQVKNMTVIESDLNKSMNELSSTYETNVKQMQRIEDKEKLNRCQYDTKTSHLEYKIQKLKEDIQLTKNELSDQRKECSVLKQDNLTKGFKIQELERKLKEKESLLNVKKAGLRIKES